MKSVQGFFAFVAIAAAAGSFLMAVFGNWPAAFYELGLAALMAWWATGK